MITKRALQLLPQYFSLPQESEELLDCLLIAAAREGKPKLKVAIKTREGTAAFIDEYTRKSGLQFSHMHEGGYSFYTLLWGYSIDD